MKRSYFQIAVFCITILGCLWSMKFSHSRFLNQRNDDILYLVMISNIDLVLRFLLALALIVSQLILCFTNFKQASVLLYTLVAIPICIAFSLIPDYLKYGGFEFWYTDITIMGILNYILLRKIQNKRIITTNN